MSERFKLAEPKSAWEKWFVEVDVAKWLGEETIASVEFLAKSDSGEDVTATLLDAAKNTWSGSLVKPYVRAGTSGNRYFILLRVTSSGQNYREFVVELLVKDTP